MNRFVDLWRFEKVRRMDVSVELYIIQRHFSFGFGHFRGNSYGQEQPCTSETAIVLHHASLDFYTTQTKTLAFRTVS